ncbi:hypothetical protein, partial [Staphylococcus aureus]|uniref:hypothetical protein n=1 Tax=Staphylococcus aureus TaxID=1280 RepID=UPI00301BE931
YELSAELQSFDGELRDGGEVSVGDVVFGELPSGGRLVYRLVVDERRPVRIETASLAVDTVLTLEGGALHREDDDGGAGTGSRISEVLAPGVYDIEVRGFGDGAGLVRLELADE